MKQAVNALGRLILLAHVAFRCLLARSTATAFAAAAASVLQLLLQPRDFCDVNQKFFGRHLARFRAVRAFVQPIIRGRRCSTAFFLFGHGAFPTDGFQAPVQYLQAKRGLWR